MLLGAHIRNFGVLHDTVFGVAFTELAGLTASQAATLDDPERSPVPAGRLPLGSLCTLIGRNSTGKSALFSALSFLCDCLRHDVPFACEQNGRRGFTSLKTKGDLSDICFSLVFAGETDDAFINYEVCLSSDRHGRPFVACESVRQTRASGDGFETEPLLELSRGRGAINEDGQLKQAAVAETRKLALASYGQLLGYPVLNSIHGQVSRWFFDHIAQSGAQPRRAEPTRQGGHRHISATGDNVSNVLEFLRLEHPERYELAMTRIAERMPSEKRIDQALSNGVSPGTRKLYTLLLLLEDPDPRPLICLEEPDAGLYHDMVDSLAFALRDFTIRNPQCQVMFTTHSPYILESMRPEEVWVFERQAAAVGLVDALGGSLASGAPGLTGAAITPDGPQGTAAGPQGTPDGPQGTPAGPKAPVGDPYTHTRCLARDPVVRAMHAQGIGLGAMWYSGHLDHSWEEIHGTAESD